MKALRMLLSGGVLLTVGAMGVGAQDVMVAAANHYKVLVDNDNVRVVENTLAPGEKDPVHTHPAGWYYVTRPGKMKVVPRGWQVGDLGGEGGGAGLDEGGRAAHVRKCRRDHDGIRAR